jgi:hypothetical protein
MSIFAVETQYQHPKAITQIVLTTAFEIGYVFKHLDVLDRIEIGSVQYQRFKVLDTIDVTELLDALFKSGRAVIGPGTEGFTIRIRSKVAKVPFSLMQAAPRTSVQYRGPGDQYWQRQFE